MKHLSHVFKAQASPFELEQLQHKLLRGGDGELMIFVVTFQKLMRNTTVLFTDSLRWFFCVGSPSGGQLH
jgi:hypothetical protein